MNKDTITPPNGLSRFSRCLWLIFGIFVVFTIAFDLYVHSEKQTDRAIELRMQSFLLADELRQSSDDLTRMARSYVITGDPIYKQHYQEILDIRDGKKPRPVNYHEVYWDLVTADDQRPKPSGQTTSLLDRMQQMDFSKEEFAKLAEAKANSDALTRIEFAAMKRIESAKPPTAIDRLQASLLLQDATYYQGKTAIMRPISEFYRIMEQHSQTAVHATQTYATLLRGVLICFGLSLLVMLWRAYRILYAIVGGEVDTLHNHIVRLGHGDFSSAIPVTKDMKNSVMAWLSETQTKLAQLNAERDESEAKNHRLTQLYSALSQCNQAIVRCSNEQELFAQICQDAVIYGGIKMAWIGFLDEHGKDIKPLASYGSGTEYLEGIHISIDANEPAGRGPTGTAMREDRPFWCQNFQHDPATLLWHERGAEYNWKASAALPLHKNGIVIGAFTLYSSEADAFDEAAQNLLIEMTIDIDYALYNFEREAQRKQVEKALADSHKLLMTVINTAPIRIFWKDRELRYLGCNTAFARDAGVVDPQDLIAKNDYQLAWKDCAEIYRTDDRKIINSGIAKLFYEEPLTGPDGNTIWIRTSKVPLLNEVNEVIGILGIYEDITEQKRAQEHIHYLVNFDSLTGLPNRAQLDILLNYALTLAKRSNGNLALMFLDLDHFKDINDTLGHSVGDEVLIELAKRLRVKLREQDTVSRLGGDEFIFILPGVDMQGAAIVAQKLLDAITAPYHIKQHDLILTASIGIAIYPNDGLNLETLCKNADTAMYCAKQEGRQGFRLFTPEMQSRSVRNMQLVNALRHALKYDQLQLHYQPQISMHDRSIIGAEALLRWFHPEFGSVSPMEFIPIAEESGLILSIGEWVIRSAVRQAKIWLDKGFAPLTIAVNLSAMQFCHPNLPNLVSRILATEGLAPDHLELELTESVTMRNPQDAIAIMNNLYTRGIRMSIDDFGTGYSSLSYLKKFKVYKLKIDQSFVRDISTDPEDKAIVGAIINMSKSLGLRTIAEGVETEEQLAFLRTQGCDEAQGYLFSKALPAEQFESLLRSSPRRLL